MTAEIDYYSVLGVSRDATDDEIKKAFRKRARECHPDVAGHDGAEEEFKRVNEAYEVLSDPSKRDMYDRFGTAGPRAGFPGGAGGGYGFDISDLFDIGDVFSSFFGGAAAQQARTEGRDMGAQVVVTLEEAAEGVTREIDLVRMGACEECGGTGAAEGGRATSCPGCQGTGRKRTGRRTFLGVVESVTPCTDCGATGTVVDIPCPSCSSTGRQRVSQRVAVDVPSGVPDGMTLRVRGMGEAGLRNDRPGDLLVTVRVEPHEYLHRQGDDLHEQVGIGIAEAALGGEIEVAGLEGPERVRIRPGTQPGDVVRLAGRGMPRYGSGGRGDLHVHVAVDVAKKLSKRQRELLAELRDSFGEERPGALRRLKEWLAG